MAIIVRDWRPLPLRFRPPSSLTTVVEPSPPRQVVVLIVDDHPVVRRGLAALLTREAWVTRVVEADTVAKARALAVRERPAVAVVDIELPDGDGLDVVSELARTVPQCRCVIFTMHSDPILARKCLAAGAAGFLVKETDPEAVARFLLTVLDGGTVIDPHLDQARLFTDTDPEVSPPFDVLSTRDQQIVRRIAAGASNAQIAAEFSLADKTVRNKITQLVVEMGVRDRVGLVLLARDRKLL